MSYLQNFNFAWGVVIFSGEERSEIWRFWEGSNSQDGRRGKLKHDRVKFFQNFHHGVGDSVNFAQWFSRRAWLFQAVNVRVSLDKSKCSGVQSPVSDDESPVHSSQQEAVSTLLETCQWCSPSGCSKVKTRKSSDISFCCSHYRWTGHLF